jgi:sulfide:quinone oxidoreductase
VIAGGGSAGISVAARLRHALKRPDILIIDPATYHYYQPLWTLVGGGVVHKEETQRLEKQVIPPGVGWLQESVTELDPATNSVVTSSGKHITYEYLVVALGIQIDWNRIDGLERAVGHDGVVSN